MKQELGRRTAIVASESTYAQKAEEELRSRYLFAELEDAEILLVLGGDGFMLEMLHANLDKDLKIYGMNLGTVGFLLNPVSYEHLDERLLSSEEAVLHPLRLSAHDTSGNKHSLVAFNDVSILRSSTQSSHLSVRVDGVERMERLIGDGVLVATAAGSSAYNASAGGSIIPLGADIMALTPICTSSHRRWRGALLEGGSIIDIKNLDPHKRPVTVDADSERVDNISHIEVRRDMSVSVRVLFDPGHALEERILRLQFE